MILKCTCRHEWQDKRYGAGNRVHNPVHKDRIHVGWRCTVCKTKKDLSGKTKE